MSSEPNAYSSHPPRLREATILDKIVANGGVMSIALFFIVWRSLRRLPVRVAEANEYGIWVPFVGTVGIFVLAFYGLAYSLFPYLVVDRLSIWQAASAPESLMIVFLGTCVVLPMIIGYNIFVYRVFGGKAQALDYGGWDDPLA